MKTAISKIENNKEISKAINANEYYSIDRFVLDAKEWVKAIKDNRMLCVVSRVSTSGMSRVFKYHSFEKSYYRSYYTFLTTLGYKWDAKNNGIKVGGCGMDMNFHTNYTVMHKLQKLGLVSKKQCDVLAQKTPIIL